jgi:peptide/nickel transport system permease protein
MTARDLESGSGSTAGRSGRGKHAGPASGPFLGQGRTDGSQPGPGSVVLGSRQRWSPARLPGQLRAALQASPLACLAGLILVCVAVFCFGGPLLYHTDLVHVHLSLGNLSPRAGHLLGTDSNGQDELGELMAGGQISLEVGVAAGVLAAVVGSLWGAVAGYLGGVADAVMMRVVDAGIAIPTLVLLLLVVSIYRPTAWVLMLAIAATSWLGTARLVRAETLTLRTRDYVQAVRAMGGSGGRVVLRHIAPNALGTITVNVSFQIANAILVLATLSFLNLGVQSPGVDWGDMIASGMQQIYNGYWWQIVPPGIAICLVVVAFTMLGDALRDRVGADD